MSAFLMEMGSLSSLGNWFYFETDREGTYRQCSRKIKEFLGITEKNEDNEENKNWNEDFAKKLYELNCYSLNQRYGDELSSFEEFEYKEVENISIIQALKSVQCWLYQSCEGDAEEKPLFKLMEKIENILLSAIVSNLKEYENAKWR